MVPTVVLAVVKRLICANSGCTHTGLVSSAVRNVIPQLFGRVMALFPAGSRRLLSFTVALVSLNVLGVIINIFIIISLCYVVGEQMARMQMAMRMREGIDR